MSWWGKWRELLPLPVRWQINLLMTIHNQHPLLLMCLRSLQTHHLKWWTILQMVRVCRFIVNDILVHWQRPNGNPILSFSFSKSLHHLNVSLHSRKSFQPCKCPPKLLLGVTTFCRPRIILPYFYKTWRLLALKKLPILAFSIPHPGRPKWFWKAILSGSPWITLKSTTWSSLPLVWELGH